MDQRRYPGHSHWFYESQASPRASQTAPLVPAAAEVDDRFLLGLGQETSVPASLLEASEPVLQMARELSQRLLPDALSTDLLHTLTLYDRLSVALTVAQVAGVQRLCNHYAARLNPLPGPDSSRESNNRLTQITQYTRQLATQPELITPEALAALDAVGLSEPDIVTLNQLIGFVCYQARVVAGLQALMGFPVRWLPGMATPPDADSAAFAVSTEWQPAIRPVELRYASSEQLAAITFCQALPALQDAIWLLAQDAVALYGWAQLQLWLAQQHTSPFMALAQAVSARINGSARCFQHCQGEMRTALLAGVDQAAANLSDRESATVIMLAAQMTRAPERLSAAQLQPLTDAGWSQADCFALIQTVALANWNNRLFAALSKQPQSAR
ncbi:carboxymuconolactone decarboxylase family protein [[Erwinia] mediterraneensis]|uniref:carboxymuconolactone decarboxylase family protein n=1 Tax=[Erwinia] mediterraneensis TaxID=2161819 RepID=UPI001030D8C0|nr:oxidoreductase [[Erwinia] mediterraneensis]